ncbi:MAG: sigma-54-dependent Fis family transcriptional regulator [Candidatus Aminicenantes bacterium]|nr:sigma-54-dependent Fis family transcriptional regulator [Candidatus Aminicenantes bacterium]
MKKRKKEIILLVDDDLNLLANLTEVLEKNGYAVLTTSDGNEVMPMMENFPVDAIILDLKMPTLDGMIVLQKVVEKHPSVPIIILSAFGSIDDAVKATKLGAFDFVEKPMEPERILITLENALKNSRLQKGHYLLLQEKMERYQMIGESEAMNKIFALIEKIAPGDSSVLISGENGTGKELIANALHLRSKRADERFVPVNCAAIPKELIEAELFGFEKGSFTHAIKKKVGKFVLAAGGTLFLDEIGDMSLDTQAKVLRAVESGEVQPIGRESSIQVDVRIAAATNKDLRKMVQAGTFREDLYYRLNVIEIHVPPLRKRKEDIPVLAEHYLNRFCLERKTKPVQLSPGANEALIRHKWPGNVRELRNLMEKTVVLADSETISGDEIQAFLEGNPVDKASNKTNPGGKTLEEIRINAERDAIKSKLMANDWNYMKAAGELAISRATLFKKIKDYGISRNNRS